MAFCPNCGKPVDTSDNFCKNCGQSLKGTMSPGKQTLSAKWEYKEFTESLGNAEINYRAYFEKQPFLTHSAVLQLVNEAVHNLLQRVGPDGWEPIEGIEPNRLMQANRVVFTYREQKRLLAGTKYFGIFKEVHLYCKREVTGFAMPISTSGPNAPQTIK